MPLLIDRPTRLLNAHYGTYSPGRKNQKLEIEMLPEQDKTKPLTYEVEVKIVITDPPQFARWPRELGKVKVSYHTEAESFDEKYIDSEIDTEANRLKFEDDIHGIRWANWLLILIEFEYDPVKDIVESLEATYTNIQEEIEHEHIDRMRRASYTIKLKRDPDLGVNGDDGSIYCCPVILNDDWPPVQYDYSDRSGSPNDVNAVNGVNGHR